MTAITTRTRVNSHGDVIIPLGTSEAGRDVIVTITPITPKMSQKQWQEFIDRTAGSIDDPDFVRPPQGDYEQRESMG